jgi:D-beta-D-heptose 7-phosphate kinase/D-beta-D-heptose 1-phosphate adenosyltransferase
MKTHPRVSGNGNVDPLFQQYEEKFVLDYSKLQKIAEGYQALGRKVVITIGSWDGLHIGQVRYIIRARAAGNLLIVAFDTDRAIKLYKGPLRPLVPQEERAEMLTYLDAVSFVTAIDDVDEQGRWQYELLKVIKPDVFVAVVDSYPKEQLNEIQSFVKEPVVVLERQADTSTSAVIAKMMKESFLMSKDDLLDAFETVLNKKMKRKDPVHADTTVHTKSA